MFATTIIKTTRRLPIALAALGLAAVWAPAQAGAQQAPPAPADETIILEAGNFCSFEVEIVVEGKFAILALPNATIYTAPSQTATVTNTETGETIELHVSGTAKVLRTGEVVFVGPSLIRRHPDFGDDVAALVYVAGRWVFDPEAPAGLKLTGVGQYVDICAALA